MGDCVVQEKQVGVDDGSSFCLELFGLICLLWVFVGCIIRFKVSQVEVDVLSFHLRILPAKAASVMVDSIVGGETLWRWSIRS
jgi:hypothetical protein